MRVVPHLAREFVGQPQVLGRHDGALALLGDGDVEHAAGARTWRGRVDGVDADLGLAAARGRRGLGVIQILALQGAVAAEPAQQRAARDAGVDLGRGSDRRSDGLGHLEFRHFDVRHLDVGHGDLGHLDRRQRQGRGRQTAAAAAGQRQGEHRRAGCRRCHCSPWSDHRHSSIAVRHAGCRRGVKFNAPRPRRSLVAAGSSNAI